MSVALRFETLACLGEGGGRVPCNAAHVALVRFNRPMTDDEWRAFAETCAEFGQGQPTPALIAAWVRTLADWNIPLDRVADWIERGVYLRDGDVPTQVCADHLGLAGIETGTAETVQQGSVPKG